LPIPLASVEKEGAFPAQNQFIKSPLTGQSGGLSRLEGAWAEGKKEKIRGEKKGGSN